MSADVVIDSLQRAVAAAPDDVALRLHLVELLIGAGRNDEAVEHCGVALQRDAANGQARRLMLRAMGVADAQDANGTAPASPDASPRPRPSTGAPSQPSKATPQEPDPPASDASSGAFDWDAAERGFEGGPQLMFVSRDPEADAPQDVWDVESPRLTLADVGGLDAVKERLTVGFLAPMRNPEMRRMYAKTLRGGMLLYGPPGCGKTFIARAVAGELGAKFLSVGISDVLDMYFGSSEQNLHQLFEQARREAPVVLFLDEVDALGAKRTSSGSANLRTVVNQLLTELDGIDGGNEGVFVMAATNQPWDVDPALRRPGRLDRTLLVLPPDAPAREAIFAHHLKSRPIEGIDLARLAAITDGLTGADIALVCEGASEVAMMESIRTGTPRYITMSDLECVAAQTRPSTGDWFLTARNVVQFGDANGEYGELRAYMKKAHLL